MEALITYDVDQSKRLSFSRTGSFISLTCGAVLHSQEEE
jgi:hypothetical protein